MRMMRAVVVTAAFGMGLAGCKEKVDNTENYIKAIDAYYASEQACLFSETVQMPMQVYTSDADYIPRFDALYEQGLVEKGPSVLKEKVGGVVTSKPVMVYDLSNKGMSAWTADPKQPGHGNFCYGSRAATTIDSSTENSGEVGATTEVKFHTHVGGTPAWAMAVGTQNAFPELKAELMATATGTATLTRTAAGWVVTSGHPVEKKPDGVK
jgi:hypothetical protein